MITTHPSALQQHSRRGGAEFCVWMDCDWKYIWRTNLLTVLVVNLHIFSSAFFRHSRYWIIFHRSDGILQNGLWSSEIWRCACLVTWFCYQMIAKPGNKTGPPSWPDPYIAKAIVLLFSVCGHCLDSQMATLIGACRIQWAVPLLYQL